MGRPIVVRQGSLNVVLHYSLSAEGIMGIDGHSGWRLWVVAGKEPQSLMKRSTQVQSERSQHAGMQGMMYNGRRHWITG